MTSYKQNCHRIYTCLSGAISEAVNVEKMNESRVKKNFASFPSFKVLWTPLIWEIFHTWCLLLMSQPFPPDIQNIINPKLLELENWNFERMFIPHHMSCVMCHVSRVTCPMLPVTCKLLLLFLILFYLFKKNLSHVNYYCYFLILFYLF